MPCWTVKPFEDLGYAFIREVSMHSEDSIFGDLVQTDGIFTFKPWVASTKEELLDRLYPNDYAVFSPNRVVAVIGDLIRDEECFIPLSVYYEGYNNYVKRRRHEEQFGTIQRQSIKAIDEAIQQGIAFTKLDYEAPCSCGGPSIGPVGIKVAGRNHVYNNVCFYCKEKYYELEKLDIERIETSKLINSFKKVLKNGKN